MNGPDRPGERLETAAALMALVAAWAVLAWPWLSGAVTIPWDAKAVFYPQLQFLAASFAAGDSPFWNPYVFAGHPQIADPQSLIFAAPFALLAALMPEPGFRAFDAATLAAPLIGGAAIVLWFRARGWHWAGGLVAALAFAFGASMAWRLQHVGQLLSLAHLPVALWLLDGALRRGVAWRGALAGLVLGSMLIGRDQVALLGAYAVMLFVVVHWLTAERRAAAFRASLPPLFAAGLVAVLVAAVPVLLTALTGAQSNRPAIDLEGAGRGSLHPAQLLTMVAADLFGAAGRMEDYWGPPSFAWPETGLFVAQNMGVLYMGALPLLLLAFGAAGGLLWAREARPFTVGLAASLIYALGWYTPVFAALHAWLPGVDLFRRPADATFLIGAFAALLAGYVTHRVVVDPAARRGAWALACGLVALAWAGAWLLALWRGRFPDAAWPLATAALALLAAGTSIAVLRRTRGPATPLAAAASILLLVADLGWHNRPNGATGLSPSAYAVLDPTRPQPTLDLLKARMAAGHAEGRRERAELVGLGFAWPNAAIGHRIETTLGYNPLRLGNYSRATGAGDHVALPSQKSFAPAYSSYASTLANLLGLRYIASGVPIGEIDRRAGAGDVVQLARTADGYVYETRHALPRAVFANAAERADFERILAEGAWPAADYRSTVLLEDAPADGRPRRPGSARIVAYANAEVELDVESPDGGWAVLHDGWHPWWVARVDGAEVPMLRANLLFRAVEVPAGRHRVRFAFEPLTGALRELR